MKKGINKEEILKLVDKIEMYKQEEKKLQNSIMNILEEMKEYLKDSNYEILKSRLELLYMDFNTSVCNKDRYSQLILNIVNSYEKFINDINSKIQ